MRLLLLTAIIFITGCTTVPVKQQFPAIPSKLSETCPDLKVAPENTTSITELLKIVIENYQLYYECKNKNAAWKEWYDSQKNISDKINK